MKTSDTRRFRGFIDLVSELERARNLGRRGDVTGREESARTHATAWVPTSDVVARGKDLVILVEIAGVPPEDIMLSVVDGVLTLSGERDPYPDADDLPFYTRERFFGQFRRSMVLPEGADPDKISAEFSHGVVTITVPGGAGRSTEPHRVPIRVR